MELRLNSAAAAPAHSGRGLSANAYAAPVAGYLEELDRRVLAQASEFDPDVVAYLEYVLGCHGKRLRPTLALLSGLGTGGITDNHLDLGIIVEMIHLATLVHDDIMDGASQRRGQPTAAHRWGAEISVLVGDCLFAHALKLCATRFSQEISREISSAVCEVCSGEILQTQRRFDLSLGLDDYMRIIRMKTGELFRIPCELAAKLNGAPEPVCAGLRRYGESLGIAYQIYDDILDLLGTEEETGKTLGTDLERGKITLPLLYLLESVDGAEHEALCESLLHGNGQGDGGSRAIIAMAKERGALRRSVDTLRQTLAACTASLEVLPAGPARESLAQIPASLERAVADLSLRA